VTAVPREHSPATPDSREAMLREPLPSDVLAASRGLASTPRDPPPQPAQPSFPPIGRDTLSRTDQGPQQAGPSMRMVARPKRKWVAPAIGLLWFIAAGMLVLSLVLRADHDPTPKQPPPPEQLEQVKVNVGSKPIGARVEVAATGEYLGNTPLELSFPKDAVPKTLKISSPGYQPVTMDVAPGNSRVWAELEPSTQ
jgi:hypothetical protein